LEGIGKVWTIQSVKAKDIAKYALLPGIIPRLNAFVESGFGWLAFTMAIVYSSVRLLPYGHPYLNPQNMGKFGIRHVITEAVNNLTIKKENIDQIIIFFTLLLGFILLVLQFLAIIVGFFIKPAAALSVFAGMFTTPNCTTLGQNAQCTDIAFMLLDKVFGVPRVFNSAFAPAGTAFGDIPVMNRALQELFQYYSYAILIVGIVILLYYVIVIVGETAQSGTPFGRRFNHIYAPLRLVIAVGFLVPLNYGLNSAQYITLYAAKFGSGFATNGWIIFNNALAAADTPIGTHQESLIARPQMADLTHIVAFMSIVKTCYRAYQNLYSAPPNNIVISPWLAKNHPSPFLEAALLSTYQDALAFYDNKDVKITFGMHYPIATNKNFAGNVRPYCGQITIHTNVGGIDASGAPPVDQRLGPWLIQKAYFDLINQLWTDTNLVDFGDRVSATHTGIPDDPCSVGASLPGACPPSLPPADWKQTAVAAAKALYDVRVMDAYNQMVSLGGAFYDIPPELLNRGWGGAAIWYNHIAEWNGALFTAAINSPTPSLMPEVMKKIEEERRSHNQASDMENRYDPTIQGTKAISNVDGNLDMQIAMALNDAYKYWQTDGKGLPSDMQSSGNVFFDLLNAVFGIGGLFTMRTNDDVHPLAQLSALGKSIIESSIRNLMTALVFSAGGGMGEIIGTHLGAAMNSISSMFVAFTSIGLTIGFILYYVLPFLPFMYFFFAVGGWVKTIFEAMVGVPLWALAHLRIDGNGLPGDAASNGYFLIFEIFVRPILTVFGLIAAMAIFAAMARTLNGIFDLVIENLTGFDCTDCNTATIIGIEYKRNVIDEFFFTIIYTILVYMLATSSFKMIDQIPNNILRWMGAGVQTFSGQGDDPASGMVQYAAFGGAQMAGQISNALQQGARTAGQGLGLPFGLMAGRNAATKLAESGSGAGAAASISKTTLPMKK